MKIKPTKPDDSGVRWCSENCSVLSCDDEGYYCVACDDFVDPYGDIKTNICEPWVREMVKLAGKMHYDSTIEYYADEFHDLLNDDEIEVA